MGVAAVLLAAALGLAAGGEASLESGVLFGTTCARCHEGECSGRLSFESGPEAAVGHIRRHAGPVSDASVQELFALLERMKKDCAYPPLAAPIPEDGIWSSQLLARLCIPSRRACLLPLGTLEPGSCAIELRFDGEPHVHAEVVTRGFDLLLDEAVAIEAGKAAAAFDVSQGTEAFLRIFGQAPVPITRVSLECRQRP